MGFMHFYPLVFQEEGVFLLPAPVHLYVCPSICLFVHKLYFVHMITPHKFELESPNLHQTCIMGFFQLVIKIESLTITFQVNLAILTQNSKK